MKNGLQAFTPHPSEMSAMGLLLWNFHYMKWNAKLVKIGVNRTNINQLLQDFKIKMTTLLTVLVFPNNRRTCWSILTKTMGGKKTLLLLAAQNVCDTGISPDGEDVASWSSATSKHRDCKWFSIPFLFCSYMLQANKQWAEFF